MVLFLLMFACKGEPTPEPLPELTDSYEPPVLPVLSVTGPERGAFTGSARVQVSGEVLAGDAPLQTITVNDHEIDFEGGAQAGAEASFTREINWQPGINILGVEAVDADGERALDGRAFLAGPVHDPGVSLPEAVRMQVGPTLLDDNSDDVDDIARIAEIMMMDPSVTQAIIGQPMESDYFILTPTSLSFADASVDLLPASGELVATITLYDVWMDFDVDGTGWYSSIGTSGSAWVDQATLDMTIAVSASGGTVLAEPTYTETTLDGYGLTVDWFPDSLEGYLADWTQETIQDQITTTAEDMVGSLVGDLLSSLVMDIDITDGVTLNLALSTLSVRSDGLRMTLDAGVTGLTAISLPQGAGSLATEGTAPAWPLGGAAPLAVAADDDFVNQLLFAFWANGSLTGFSFSGVEIGGLSGAQLPEPIGPADQVELGMGLPPVLASPSQDDQDADLELGELRLVFHRDDGAVMEFDVSARAGLTVDITEDAELDVALDGRPSKVELEIGVIEAPENLDPGDLAALVRLMIPPLLKNAAAFMPAMAVPSIPLDSFSSAPELQGKSLTIAQPTVAIDDGGWLLLTAGIQEAAR